MRRCTWSVIVSMVVASLAGSAIAEQQPSPALVMVKVDTFKPRAEINRDIYGQFIEHQGTQIYDGIWVGEDSPIPNVRGYRKDVLSALKALHIPVLRWPGGCFADQYDWRDGIGSRDSRPVRINSLYGGTVESNAFGTHEFLDFAELIGADPYVSLNVGSMTPIEAARWLEYMTSDEKSSSLVASRRKNGRARPWKIKYLGLGNELWDCGGSMRAESIVDMTRRFSKFLNIPNSPELIKVASGPSANLSDDAYGAFAEALMKNATALSGELVFRALSLHYYAFPIAADREISKANDLMEPNAPPLTPATEVDEHKWGNILRSALGMEYAISSVSIIMDKYDPARKVSLVVDEWGAWHEVEPGAKPWSAYQQSTLLDAEVAALTLNIFHRHTERVKMANNSETVNALQAIILTQREKMLLTPAYHVFDMYQPFQGAIPYPTTVSGPQYEFDGHKLPSVDISAARGKDGKLYLALVNLDPHRSADVVTNLTGKARGRILTGPAMDTHNTFESPETIHPMPFIGFNDSTGRVALKLPARSVAVVSVE